MRQVSSFVLLFGALIIGLAQAQTTHPPMDHSQHARHAATTPESLQPREGGQSAFAAMQEILVLLSADPQTDWGNVDIDALREHLVDMDQLTLQAQARPRQIEGGLSIWVTGTGRVLEAIQRMVPAHAQELDKYANWSAEAERQPTGVTLNVTSTVADEVVRIRALGFFGLMATGAHHQAHHLAIAQGRPMH